MTPNNLETETIFRVLFAIAWTDGELAEQERMFLKELYERVETDFDAGPWFEKPPQAPDWNRLRADAETKEALLRQAMHVAAADQRVTIEENWLLDRLRAHLGLSEDRFHELQLEVEQQRA
ncbi:MAG: TerB family tellurite resistance protein [Myxococcota bacterium]